MAKHVVMFSGGAGSWMTAKRVAEKHGTENLVLLFADTKMEDEDLYRFLDDAARDIGVPVTRVAEGRNPWEVFFDKRYLGNTRIDPCSSILKRELLRKWLERECDPNDTIVYIGIDWTEEHRFSKAQKYWTPWRCESPLLEAPLMGKPQQLEALRAAGIEVPRLYKMGFSHNNCGGFCIKSGQGHFARLLEHMPERFAYHEQQEQKLREHLGKDVAILRHRSGPDKGKPMPLRVLRQRIEGKQQIDMWEIGGCACFSPGEGEEPQETETA